MPMSHTPRAVLLLTCLGIVMAIIAGPGSGTRPSAAATSFADDVAFLAKHTKVLTLSDASGNAQVLLSQAWQGRVLTSTATGTGGLSYGWINRELIASGKFIQHMNPFGGEDRFWIGPEGGQFSVFFAKGAKFDLDHWVTPAPFDTEPFEVVKSAKDSAEFRRSFALTNYSGTAFNVRVNRTVRLLTPAQAVSCPGCPWKTLDVGPSTGIKMVAFESANTITNEGKTAWTTDRGLLSIWILGMFNPSPATTIVVPIKAGPVAQLGKAVNADYFGPVPPDRLVVRDNVLFFSGDGQYRSKIGISPTRVRPILGSYDSVNNVLTLVIFTTPPAPHGYVNSMWEIQKNPFGGDVANSYNDGAPSPGAKPLGPFYELESSSPAAALAPGASTDHVHRTMHLTGPKAALDAVAKAALGVGLDEITRALPKK